MFSRVLTNVGFKLGHLLEMSAVLVQGEAKLNSNQWMNLELLCVKLWQTLPDTHKAESWKVKANVA